MRYNIQNLATTEKPEVCIVKPGATTGLKLAMMYINGVGIYLLWNRCKTVGVAENILLNRPFHTRCIRVAFTAAGYKGSRYK